MIVAVCKERERERERGGSKNGGYRSACMCYRVEKTAQEVAKDAARDRVCIMRVWA